MTVPCGYLVASLLQIYNEEEKAEPGKRIQNARSEEKRSSRKCNVSKSFVQGDKMFEEKANAQWNKRSADLIAGPHPAKIPTFEKELKKTLSCGGNRE